MNSSLERFRASVKDSDIFTLKIIHLALCSGLAIFAGVIFFLGQTVSSKVTASSDNIALIQIMTMVHGAMFVIVISLAPRLVEIILRKSAKIPPEYALNPIRASTIMRLALLEGVALFGLVICFLAMQNGVLNTEPIYYLNMLSAVFFVVITLTNLPTRQKLEEIFQTYFMAR